MRPKLLKISRVAVSLFFLTVSAFLFVDFAETLSSSLINGITWIQFVPSLVKFVALTGFLTFGFILVIVATLLFGRIYCSTVCPLGILQDVSSRISRFYTEKLRKKRNRYRFTRPQNLLRYTLLGVTVITFAFGSIFFLNLLDPFSLFGKIFSGLARPVYYTLNNITADLFYAFGNYTFYHVETRQMTVLPLIYPALMLVLVVGLSLMRGRLYCNTVCPVGTLLGVISKYAMYRIEIDEELCNRCAECSLNCKAQCIDLKNNEIDFTRCVGCFNCLDICSRQGIDYQNKWFASRKKAASPEVMDELCNAGKENASAKEDIPLHTTDSGRHTHTADSGRRSFLFRLTSYFIGFSAASRVVRAEASYTNMQQQEPDIRDDLDVAVTKPSTIPEDKQFPISPPGSLSLEHYTDVCTACQLCISACPTRVLQPSFLEYGFTGMMQPRMDFHAGFCNFDCVICTEICPTGAILPLSMEEKHVAQIGVVHLELDNCVVQTENTACGACAEHCPTQAVKMVPYQDGLTIPEIVVEHCVGCGACEYICPTRPYRAIYVDGNEVHQKATPPVIEELDYEEPEEDFPF